MLGDFIKKDDNWAGVSAMPTFAEDRAARLETINPYGLRTSSTAQLISERGWSPTNSYGYGGDASGITGIVNSSTTPSDSSQELSDVRARTLLADLGLDGHVTDPHPSIQLAENSGRGSDVARTVSDAGGGISRAGGSNPNFDPRDYKNRQAADSADARLISDKLNATANYWAAKSTGAFNAGDREIGEAYLRYANEYYQASGGASEMSNYLGMASPRYRLPIAATGAATGDLRFELKLGAAGYAIIGGNVEFTANINISQPFQSSVTEFEGGLGVGVSFKGTAGLQFLKDAEHAAAIPFKIFDYYGSGQANDTGAISTKLSAEVALPFATLTAVEIRGGVQAPLTRARLTKENYGLYGEIKYLEPKISPAMNLGATVKWDVFNTAYKRSP